VDVMSDQDNIKPFHAKEAAPGQEAADVVAEVLQHAAERDAAAKQKTTPKGPPKWMLPLTVNLGVLAMYFLIAQPDFLVVNPIDEPRSGPQVALDARNTIYMFGIQPVERFREEHGRLPTTLREAGSPLEDSGAPVEYSAQDGSYVISLTVGDNVIRFDSANDDPMDFPGPMNLGG
jgi:hypothetical protein